MTVGTWRRGAALYRTSTSYVNTPKNTQTDLHRPVSGIIAYCIPDIIGTYQVVFFLFSQLVQLFFAVFTFLRLPSIELRVAAYLANSIWQIVSHQLYTWCLEYQSRQNVVSEYYSIPGTWY